MYVHRSRTRLWLLIGPLVALGALAGGCAGPRTTASTDPAGTTADRRGDGAAAAERSRQEEAKAREVTAERARREAAKRAREFQPIYFDYDASRISPGEVGRLRYYVRRLQEHPRFRLRLEGHCDERGTTAYNLALGLRRAESVRSFLIRAGIDGDRLVSTTLGEERPAEKGSNEAAWARNRRVEFEVIAP